MQDMHIAFLTNLQKQGFNEAYTFPSYFYCGQFPLIFLSFCIFKPWILMPCSNFLPT